MGDDSRRHLLFQAKYHHTHHRIFNNYLLKYKTKKKKISHKPENL